MQCPCDSCEGRATQRGIWMSHNRVHHGGTTFACDQRDYVAGNCNALKNHMKVYHNGRRCLCSCCDYKCTLGVHRGGTTFFCNQCDYMARKRNALKIHMKIKHDGRQCQCNHCELNPTQRGSLKLHKRVHRGEITHCWLRQCRKPFIKYGKNLQRRCSGCMVPNYWIVPKRGETQIIVESVGNLYTVQKARHCFLIVVVANVEVQLVARGESLATHVTMQLASRCPGRNILESL